MQKTASFTQFEPSTMYCWKLPPFLSSDSSLSSILLVNRGLKQCLNSCENDPAYTRLHLKSSHIMSPSASYPCWKLEIWNSSALMMIRQHSQGHSCGLEERMHGSSIAAGQRKGSHLRRVEMFCSLSSKICKLAGSSLPRQKLFGICLNKYQP